MSAIETKELKGVSLKTLYAIIFTTIIICTSIYGSYASIITKINEIVLVNQSNDKLYDLRLKVLEQKISAIDIQLRDLSNRK